MQTTSQTHVAIAPSPAESSTLSLKTADMIGILLLAVPLLAILSIVSYRNYRARTLKQQIATLERIWKLNSIEKTS
jgi:hypothetical protein